jgi:hypothetical protein
MNSYDLFQNFRFNGNKVELKQAKNDTADVSKHLAYLSDKVDQLSLVCMAMCELLEDIGFKSSELESKIQEIDLRDGKLDGKFQPETEQQCQSCQRKTSVRHVSCLYCGGDLREVN